jgi:acyl transferase domain-containing protein
MMAAALSFPQAENYLSTVTKDLGSRQLVVACVNSPNNVTISGHNTHLHHLQKQLESAGVFARRLRVNVAYHSFQMREILDDYLSSLGSLAMPPDNYCNHISAMISTVTGAHIKTEEVCKPEYWVRNLISPVQFSDALASICQPSLRGYKKLDGSHRNEVSVTGLIEIGPHSALSGPIREILASVKQGSTTITYTSLLVRKVSAVQTVLQAMGQLHCLGYSPALAQVNVVQPDDMKTLSTLPEYPFNKSKSYWYESRISKGYRFRKSAVNDLLGTPDPDFNALEAKWRNIIRTSNLPWLEDHKVRKYHRYSFGLSI